MNTDIFAIIGGRVHILVSRVLIKCARLHPREAQSVEIFVRLNQTTIAHRVAFGRHV